MTATLPMALADVQELVTPVLRAAVDRLDPLTRRQASYHFGWSTAEGEPDSRGGGKALRPALALLSARAAGAEGSRGLPGAVAVELVHNFSLIHDDLIDGDLTRRHRPTVWALWGVSAAVLTGDALLGLAQEVLLEVPDTGATAARLLATCTRELIRGQVEDVAFERRSDVALDECLAMADGKTGSLLAASCAIGAVLADAPVELVAALHRFGSDLGLAFQLVDDLLGIWGDPEVTGKPVGSDLRARKNSLPVCYALGRGDDNAARLLELLAGGDGQDEEERIRAAADAVEAGGGRAWAAQEASRRVSGAVAGLREAGVPDDVTGELEQIGAFVLGRQH